MFTWWKQSKNTLSPFKGRYRPVLEDLERRETPAAAVNVGDTINVSQAISNQVSAAIAVNPNNPSQVVCVSNVEDLNGDGSFEEGLFEAWSVDGGETWNTQYLFTDPNSIDAALGDAQLAWDRYGNLFVAYITNTQDVAIAYSLDGGQSFFSQVLTADGLNSNVSIATGPSNRPNFASIWVAWHVDANAAGIVPAPHLETMYAWTGGLGVISPFRGKFGPADVVPGSDQANALANDISVGPGGKVMVTYQSSGGPAAGPSVLWSNVDPDGFGPAGWGQRRFITSTNVGPTRGLDANGSLADPASINAAPGVVWNYGPGAFRGRVYFVYVNAPNTVTNDTNVFLRYSDDNGVTWSAPLQVNNVSTNSQFLPTLAVDQSTGLVAVSWYDARNSATAVNTALTNVTTQVFAAVSDDGGASFGANFLVSPDVISAGASEPPAQGATAVGVGTSGQISFVQGNLQVVWSDNSATLQGNPDLPTMDIATARVRVARMLRVRVVFPPRWRLIDATNSIFLGRLTIINNGAFNLRGPFKLTITLPDSSLSFLSPTNTKVGNTVTFTINGNLNRRVPLRVLAMLSNPLRLKLPSSLIGYATSLV